MAEEECCWLVETCHIPRQLGQDCWVLEGWLVSCGIRWWTTDIVSAVDLLWEGWRDNYFRAHRGILSWCEKMFIFFSSLFLSGSVCVCVCVSLSFSLYLFFLAQCACHGCKHPTMWIRTHAFCKAPWAQQKHCSWAHTASIYSREWVEQRYSKKTLLETLM